MVFSENAAGRQNPSTNFNLILYRELSSDWFLSFSLGYNSYNATYDISRGTTNRDVPYEWRKRLSPELLEKMRSSLRWNDTIRYYVFVADIPVLFGLNRFITNSKNRLYLGATFGTIYNGFRSEWSPMIIVPTIGTTTTIAQNLSFEANVNFKLLSSSGYDVVLYSYGINIGVAYLLW